MLLSSTDISPNACGLRHKNALHLAAAHGHSHVVQCLLLNKVRGGVFVCWSACVYLRMFVCMCLSACVCLCAGTYVFVYMKRRHNMWEKLIEFLQMYYKPIKGTVRQNIGEQLKLWQ